MVQNSRWVEKIRVKEKHYELARKSKTGKKKT
jgi:hypothetical protein